MAKFKLTNKAVEDLTNIWDYTLEVSSELQANKYYDSLIFSFQEIANNPELGKNYDGISKKLFGIKVNRNIIFYRTLGESYVEITRILHEQMDLKERLSE